MNACMTRIAACACVIAAAGCRNDSQDVRGGALGDRTLPQQAGTVNLTDSTGLPSEGNLSRVAIGRKVVRGRTTEPFWGSSSPVRSFMNVDLPEPLGPVSP